MFLHISHSYTSDGTYSIYGHVLVQKRRLFDLPYELLTHLPLEG